MKNFLLILVLVLSFAGFLIAPDTSQAACVPVPDYSRGPEVPPGITYQDDGNQPPCDTGNPGEAATKAAEKLLNSPIILGVEAGECSGLSALTNFGKCIFIKIMGWLGSWFITLGGFVLQFSGYLFNILVEHIIIKFGTTIQTLGLLGGIHSGWEILRDLSNIVIIGMFTFIAICIILGLQTFGAKKLVANVLIIAVLINFSLLFTKIIIDSSNFVAYQVYNQMGGPDSGSSANISGKFFAIVGITGAWDTAGVAQDFGETVRAQGTNSTLAGFGAFLYGLLTGTMLLAAAGVLLYGCYLIAVRAVLLVFLMIVSAIAFATYLVPKLSESGYGWKTWWKSLINAAIFGPLLMVLLYISLLILTPAAGRSSTTTGVIATDLSAMTRGDNWTTIVVFIFGIGMLYVSFRIASSFSNQIAGFSLASATAMTPFVGMSRFLGFAGRQSLGRVGEGVGARLKRKGWGDDESNFLQKGTLRAFQSLGAAKYDPLAAGLLKGIVKKTGAPDFGSDFGKGGFKGIKKRQVEHGADIARDIVPGKDGVKEAQARKIARENALKDAEAAATDAEIADLKKNGTESGSAALKTAIADEMKKDGADRAFLEERVHGKVVTPGIQTVPAERGASGAVEPNAQQNRSAIGESALSESSARAREAEQEAKIKGFEEAHPEVSFQERLDKMNTDAKERAVETAIKTLTEKVTDLRDIAKREAAFKEATSDTTVAKRQAEILERVTQQIVDGRPSAAFGLLPIDRGATARQIPGVLSSHDKAENLKALAGLVSKAAPAAATPTAPAEKKPDAGGGH